MNQSPCNMLCYGSGQMGVPSYFVQIVGDSEFFTGQGKILNDLGRIGVNNLGQHLTNYYDGFVGHVFFHDSDGSQREISSPWGSGGIRATSINNFGQVAGLTINGANGSDPSTWNHAFVTAPNGGSTTDLGTPIDSNGNHEYGGFIGNGPIVNDKGSVAGVFYTGEQPNPGYHLFASNSGVTAIYDVGHPLGQSNSQNNLYVVGFNNRGDVCGYVQQIGTNEPSVGFTYNLNPFNIIPIPQIGGNTPSPNDLNDCGIVVGEDTVGNGFLYDGFSVKDLNLMVPHQFGSPVITEGIHILSAVAVNSRGQIVANGIEYTDGGQSVNFHGLLLTPVPKS